MQPGNNNVRAIKPLPSIKRSFHSIHSSSSWSRFLWPPLFLAIVRRYWCAMDPTTEPGSIYTYVLHIRMLLHSLAWAELGEGSRDRRLKSKQQISLLARCINEQTHTRTHTRTLGRFERAQRHQHKLSHSFTLCTPVGLVECEWQQQLQQQQQLLLLYYCGCSFWVQNTTTLRRGHSILHYCTSTEEFSVFIS